MRRSTHEENGRSPGCSRNCNTATARGMKEHGEPLLLCRLLSVQPNEEAIVAETAHRTFDRSPSPLYSILLSGTVTLFLGVLLSDLAYSSSYELQWKNFASWLIVGALVFGGFTLLWGFVDLARGDQGNRRAIAYILTLLAAWVLGFINALVHAKDSWASMPAALILSVFVAALAMVAAWLRLSHPRTGGSR